MAVVAQAYQCKKVLSEAKKALASVPRYVFTTVSAMPPKWIVDDVTDMSFTGTSETTQVRVQL